MLRNTNLFTITDHDIIHILPPSKIRQTLVDPILIRDIQKAPFGSSKQSRVILYSIAFGRGINHAEHLFEVVLQQLHFVSNPYILPKTERNTQRTL